VYRQYPPSGGRVQGLGFHSNLRIALSEVGSLPDEGLVLCLPAGAWPIKGATLPEGERCAFGRARFLSLGAKEGW